MAIPRPTRATRNSTMKDTSVRYVRPRTTSNVVRIETAATTSGTKARNEANTKARTTRAPAAPMRVSVKTPGPFDDVPASSWSNPVRPTWS